MSGEPTPSPAPEPIGPTPWVRGVAVRLADEGVPINAIARAIRVPSTIIRGVLDQAYDLAQIIAVPRDDWPKGSQRDLRLPDCVRITLAEPAFITHVMRTLTLTGTQAQMLTALLRRPEMTRASLHLITQREGRSKDTEPKIVDVFMCKLRGLLKPHDIIIETIWGRGYYLNPENRAKVFNLLGLPVENVEGDEPGVDGDAQAGKGPKVPKHASGGAAKQAA